MSKWPMVKLGEVCEIRKETLSDFSTVRDLTFVGLENLNQGGGFGDLPRVGEIAPKSTKNIYRSGDILFGKLRPNLRKAALAVADGICSTDIVVVKPSSKVNAQFMYSVLLTDFFYSQVKIHVNGINLPRISAKSLLELQIPLPPLEEQKRIAGILEASARQLESLRNQIAALEKLSSQVIYEFSTSCSKFISLNEIAEVSTGATPLRKNKSYYEGTIPWVKTGEVVGSEITDTEEHISDLALKETNCRLFRAGTTLVAMYGQGATRGRAGFLSRDMATNQACAAITPIESADDRYVFNLVKASYEKLRASGRGGTQPNLNLKIVKSFEIPYPTDERLRLNLSATCMEVDTQIDALNKKINLLQELHQSLATRAFAGEL